MRITVVLVSYNGSPWLERCLNSLLIQDPLPDLIAVDNSSSDDSPQIIRDFIEANTTISATFSRLDENTGFTKGANTGLRKALDSGTDAFLLLNQDAWMEKHCLQEFAAALEEEPHAGILGARILYPDGEHIQHAGGYLETPRMMGLHYGHHEKERPGIFLHRKEVDFVTGAAMLIRRECLEDLGFFNEIFSPGYYEDVEFCARARAAGWKTLYIPKARLRHNESTSFTDQDARLRLANRNRLIFLLSKNEESLDLFEESETGFLRQQASMEELIAIKGAAIDVLIRLPLVEKALSLGFSSRMRGSVRQLLCSLHSTATKAIQTRFFPSPEA